MLLVYLARGWCIFVASLTQSSDRAELVRLFYPAKSDFLWALAAGFGAVLIYIVVIAERRRSSLWLQPVFVRLLGFLWLLLFIDAALLAQRLWHGQFLFHWSLGLDALMLFWSSLYLLKSKRLRYYLADWPSEAAAKPNSNKD